MTATSSPPAFAARTAEEFAGHLFGLFTGAALSFLIDIGHRTGLFDAAAQGPATSAGLAGRAGLQERYVREWLGAMATAGMVQYQADDGLFRLPPEHAACLTGATVANLAPLARITTCLGRHVDAVATAFRAGGGVPYAAYLPELHDVMDALWRPLFEELLVAEILPLAPGVTERFTAGARAADVACGTGTALVVLGAAFPATTFVGYDLDAAALARARAEAARRGLTNVSFEHQDAARLATDEPFDVVMVFNAIHDQAQPAAVLQRIRQALVPGGVFLMNEPRISSDLADNIGNPMAPFTYAISTLHCVTVSLAAGGAGLGTGWGEQLALRMLHDAGFGPVAVHDAPGDPGNAVFVTRRVA
jgi:SAM-dependent methyltransferase